MTTAKQRIHQYISEHPNSSVNEIAEALATKRSCISPQVSDLFQDGLLSRTGNHAGYRYTSAQTVTHVEEPVVTVNSINTVFNECRANWRGYELNRLLSGVRA